MANKFGSVALQRAKADVAASQTGQQLVAASPGKSIRVLSVAILTGGTATTVLFKSATTAISMVFQNAANGGAVLPHNPYGWFETALGEALNVDTGAGSTSGIMINYVVL